MIKIVSGQRLIHTEGIPYAGFQSCYLRVKALQQGNGFIEFFTVGYVIGSHGLFPGGVPYGGRFIRRNDGAFLIGFPCGCGIGAIWETEACRNDRKRKKTCCQ